MARTSRGSAPPAPGAEATVDALDNLNLDDMFADEGDALFDGLDGLDNIDMDAIATASAAEATGAATPPKDNDDDDDDEVAIVEEKKQPKTFSSMPPAKEKKTPATRRKTKRKVKSPQAIDTGAGTDDDFDEGPKKKKKRGVGSKTKKTKGLKTNAAEIAPAMPSPSGPASRTASSALSVVTTTSKGIMTHPKTKTVKGRTTMPQARGVAAAGQFGGRVKSGGRSSSFALPKAKMSRATSGVPPPDSGGGGPKTASSAAQILAKEKQKAAAAAASVPKVSNFAQVLANHPGLTQSPFCGILPSNTLFYPFMQSLPPEPSILKHRKLMVNIDRYHTLFANQLSSFSGASDDSRGPAPIPESHPIIQLLQEAFKDEKPNAGSTDGTMQQQQQQLSSSELKSQAIGHSVATLRKRIGQTEKNQLAADLLAICALLKRQYDFLKQNSANMQQWCKNHLAEADYAAVYLPNKKKPEASILASLNTSEIKVRVTCSGLIPPRPGPLPATLPWSTVPPQPELSKSGAAVAAAGPAQPKQKKRKSSVSLPVKSSSTATQPAEAEPQQQQVSMSTAYLSMLPSERRHCVSELVSRCAIELETQLQRQVDAQKQGMDRQRNEMKRLIEQDDNRTNLRQPWSHTTGMWRWLEKSGHHRVEFIERGEVQRRLQDHIVDDDKNVNEERQQQDSGELVVPRSSEQPEKTSYIDRLQSLLVPIDSDDDDTEVSDSFETDDDDDDDDDESVVGAWSDASLSPGRPCLLDLSDLSYDERAYLHLRSIGLLSDRAPLPSRPTAVVCESQSTARPTTKPDSAQSSRQPGSWDENDMDSVIVAMIGDLKELNQVNKGRASLLETAVLLNQRQTGGPHKKAQDDALIGKCQQLLKKSKEMRVKSVKAKTGATSKDELALPW